MPLPNKTSPTYYQATALLIRFLETEIAGSFEAFARDCDLNGRTIIRLRKGERLSSITARNVFNGIKKRGMNAIFEELFQKIVD